MSSPEVQKQQENRGEVLESKAPERKKAPKVDSKVRKLNPVRKEIGANTIDLVNEKGFKVGQAEYGMVTTPDQLQNVNIDLNNRAQETALEAAKNMDDPEAVTELIQEEITEQHLEAVLHLLFMKFKNGCGGDVFEAGKMSKIGGRDFQQKSTESKPEEGKLSRNFIIPLSGADELKSLMSRTISTSIGGGDKFDVNPYTSDFLGKDGFSYVLSAQTPGGKEMRIDVNFFYGVEEGTNVIQFPQKEGEDQIVNEEEQTNVTEFHGKPEEPASDEEEQELRLAA